MDILEYIELDTINMKTYSLKIYKLFLSICTEIENNLKGILYANNYKVGKKLNMKDDYFKLGKILKLSEYEVNIDLSNEKKIIKPFINWKGKENYIPLEWYKAYNKLKHNRSKNIREANLNNLIQAFCALYIILYSQFFKYSQVVSENYLIALMSEDCELVIPTESDIITITKEPIWKEEEKYNFDWESVKKFKSPYNFLNLE